ncbi:MAG: putative DNA binding CopG/RHH family protein [Gammaproteobacteria bacterium]
MAQALGAEIKNFMKKKIEYSDFPPGGEPIGELEIIEDFLPRPEELVFKEDNSKVTIALSRQSIKFFKSQAKKHNTQYQKMIRNLLDEYVARHQDK